MGPVICHCFIILVHFSGCFIFQVRCSKLKNWRCLLPTILLLLLLLMLLLLPLQINSIATSIVGVVVTAIMVVPGRAIIVSITASVAAVRVIIGNNSVATTAPNSCGRRGCNLFQVSEFRCLREALKEVDLQDIPDFHVCLAEHQPNTVDPVVS